MIWLASIKYGNNRYQKRDMTNHPQGIQEWQKTEREWDALGKEQKHIDYFSDSKYTTIQGAPTW